MRRRTLIPADGYFEWKRDGKEKQPYLIRMRGRRSVRLRRALVDLDIAGGRGHHQLHHHDHRA